MPTTRFDDGRLTAEPRRPPGRRPRFARLGRLAVPPGAAGLEVRCSCDRCGAHLYAAPGLDEDLEGRCFVCGGDAVTPV